MSVRSFRQPEHTACARKPKVFGVSRGRGPIRGSVRIKFCVNLRPEPLPCRARAVPLTVSRSDPGPAEHGLQTQQAPRPRLKNHASRARRSSRCMTRKQRPLGVTQGHEISKLKETWTFPNPTPFGFERRTLRPREAGDLPTVTRLVRGAGVRTEGCFSATHSGSPASLHPVFPRTCLGTVTVSQ